MERGLLPTPSWLGTPGTSSDMSSGELSAVSEGREGITRAYSGFLKRYDQEIKLSPPEYSEHKTSLDDFHKAALAANGPGGP